MKSIIKYIAACLFLICVSFSSKAVLTTPVLTTPINGKITTDPFIDVRLGSTISGVTRYRFQADTSTAFNSPLLKDTNSPTYTAYGIKRYPYGSKVYVRCKVYSNTDSSIWSNVVYAIISNKIELNLPTNNYSGAVNFLRCLSAYADGYELIFDTSYLFNSSMFCRIKMNFDTYMPDSILFNKKYYWKMRGFYKGDTLQWSDVWNFIFSPKSNIKFPARYSKPNSGFSAVNITWDNAGFSSVRLQLSKDSTFTKIITDKLILNGYVNADTIKFLDFNTTYYVRLRFETKIDSLAWAIGGAVTTVIPTITKPTNGTKVYYSGVQIEFKKVFSGSYYDTFQIQIDTNTFFTNPFMDTFTNAYVNFTKLRINKKYYTRIRGMHYRDTSAWFSGTFFSTMDQNASNFAINESDKNNTSLYLECQWYSFYGLPYILTEIDTSPLFSSPALMVYTGPYAYKQYKLSDLFFNTTYYVRCKISDLYDTSDYSKVTTFKTNSGLLTYIYPSDKARNWGIQNNLVITNPETKGKYGMKYFLWQLDTTPTFNSPVIKTGFDTGIYTFIPQGDFFLSREYYWRVAAAHDKDTAAWSPTWNYQTHITSLTKPANNSTEPNTTVTLEWGGDWKLNGYLIYMDTIPQLKATPIKKVGGSPMTYTVNNLKNGETYYWTVLPYNNIDTGLNYNIYQFKVKDLAKLTVPVLYSPACYATNVAYPDVNFSWESFNETGIKYRLQVSKTNDISSTIYDNTFTNTSAPITGFFENTTYYWRLRFERTNGDIGPWSAIYNFTTKAKPNSIKELQADGIVIYPNPIINELFIDAANEADINIINTVGQTSKKLKIKPGQNIINCSDLNPGIYIVQIFVDNKLIYRQIIKE